MRKKIKLLFFLILLFPINIYAYSSRIAVSGNTIGIEAYSDGVYIVGFYDVDGKSIGKNAGFKIGDIIKDINNNKITGIKSLNNIINYTGTYKFKLLRDNKYITINYFIENDDDIYKTGLYVKDTISGVGTLSYIDPETKIYGSLGHSIIESASFSDFMISTGEIYKAEVSSIKKSDNMTVGEVNASIYKDNVIGNISLNESSGIYGTYTGNINEYDLYDVGDVKDIIKGEAYIRTNIINNKLDNYLINIISISESDSSKNILFEITDRKLLEATGGIIQGMSGSPIIQNNKIIGVVNYVIIDDVVKGYGIFIKTMLDEGDKLLTN